MRLSHIYPTTYFYFHFQRQIILSRIVYVWSCQGEREGTDGPLCAISPFLIPLWKVRWIAKPLFYFITVKGSMNHHKTVAFSLPSIIKVDFSKFTYAEHCDLATICNEVWSAIHSFITCISIDSASL